jgi:hypothetical protein
VVTARRVRDLRCVVLREALELLLQARHARGDASAIDFELRLTGSTRADARALLAELVAAAAQARQAVAQLRELHLHHALLALRVLGEDVEDQRGAVDHVDLEQLLEVALLRGAELVVEHDEIDVEGVADHLQLLRLAGADVGGGIGPVATLQHQLDGIGTRGVGERGELLERRLRGIRVAQAEAGADEERTLPDDAEVDLGRGEPPPAHGRRFIGGRSSCRTRGRRGRRAGWCRRAPR